MTARPYLAKDFKAIKEWGAQWGSNYNEDQFPKHGFIVDGVAAYFIYSTDSTVCWLENLVTNKQVDEGVRDRALDLVIDACFDGAKKLGFKIAYATTDNFSAAKRAKDKGALAKPFNILLTKEL